ncbi:hypothetical protein K461DRAFT_113158 [Myriangium duriaei CBS 260.36]|uniref:Uncharacterized protein n=1 Tax=Myriangium duriaei CBS 260.36 TaxID=1168546 RepID=A0A9P4J7B4_9PEZI|nr:hypothetical protein K461DRAFT_113158 [Myriangium duriaei CBS 260.36]
MCSSAVLTCPAEVVGPIHMPLLRHQITPTGASEHKQNNFAIRSTSYPPLAYSEILFGKCIHPKGGVCVVDAALQQNIGPRPCRHDLKSRVGVGAQRPLLQAHSTNHARPAHVRRSLLLEKPPPPTGARRPSTTPGLPLSYLSFFRWIQAPADAAVPVRPQPLDRTSLGRRLRISTLWWSDDSVIGGDAHPLRPGVAEQCSEARSLAGCRAAVSSYSNVRR